MVVETAVPDVRELSTPEATEHADATDRDRVPTPDETGLAVERAQAALLEINARNQVDSAREAEEEAHQAALLAADEAAGREEELAMEA